MSTRNLKHNTLVILRPCLPAGRRRAEESQILRPAASGGSPQDDVADYCIKWDAPANSYAF